MENNYSKAYKEVIEILKYVPKESFEKIPPKMIDTFKTNMDNTYDFSIDVNKSFEEQELLDETKAILANIFRDYWATPYQKDRIQAKEKYDLEKIEKEKSAKYDINIFYQNKSDKIKDEDLNKEANNSLPIEIKQENFFEKIIQFFRRLFHI